MQSKKVHRQKLKGITDVVVEESQVEIENEVKTDAEGSTQFDRPTLLFLWYS